MRHARRRTIGLVTNLQVSWKKRRSSKRLRQKRKVSFKLFEIIKWHLVLEEQKNACRGILHAVAELLEMVEVPRQGMEHRTEQDSAICLVEEMGNKAVCSRLLVVRAILAMFAPGIRCTTNPPVLPMDMAGIRHIVAAQANA